jgi:hypothetical protein
MGGVIDSFFVQIGLDASQFTIGQKEADRELCRRARVARSEGVLEKTPNVPALDLPGERRAPCFE